MSPRPGQFACDLSYAGFKVTGFGTKKKEARNNAADELIKHVLGNEKKEEDDIAELDKLRDLVESKPIESKSASLSAEKPKAISKNSINTPPATVNQDKTGDASKVKVPEVSNEATTSIITTSTRTTRNTNRITATTTTAAVTATIKCNCQ